MIYDLIRPLLFALDAEASHRAAIAALAAGVYPRAPAADARLKRTVMGIEFPNPVGLAAGFDKHGEVPDAALGLGFGFVEVGSVTPRPQPGNPRPRVFRVEHDRAVINRLGFNSEGHDAVYARLAARERRGIVGVNLGTNKDSTDRVADYVAGVRRFADVAGYLAINISSPNTPGLRDLQEKDALARLLDGVAAARAGLARRVPIVVKIAPDLDDEALGTIAETVIVAGMDGMIVSNTTLSRLGVGDPKLAAESGGLSGRPLFAPSNKMLTRLRGMVGDRLVLIGTGGIDSTTAARQKIAAGADLVQLYTGMVYEGPTLPARIVAGLAAAIP
ncbi:MAG: quinone-dependent dihydroorotate dehydrogenase [Bauldia sp.]